MSGPVERSRSYYPTLVLSRRNGSNVALAGYDEQGNAVHVSRSDEREVMAYVLAFLRGYDKLEVPTSILASGRYDDLLASGGVAGTDT